MKCSRIIFVGKSGTCRAPMAAGILRKTPLKRPIEVYARGLVVQYPEPLNQKAQAVMVGNGIETAGFSSAQLKREEITDTTILLTMETRQRNLLLDMFPDVDPKKVHVLSEFVGDELEVLDPYGGALANYGLCFESIAGMIRKLAKILNGENANE